MVLKIILSTTLFMMMLNRFFVFDIEAQQTHHVTKIEFSICYLLMKHLEIETRIKLD